MRASGQLKAMFGWDDNQMPSLYTHTADRARMAKDAMSMLEKRQAISFPQCRKLESMKSMS